MTDKELVQELRDKAAVEGAGSTRRLLELAARRIEEFPQLEAVEAVLRGTTTHWYACGACGKALDPKQKYCRRCGREIIWDETN